MRLAVRIVFSILIIECVLHMTCTFMIHTYHKIIVSRFSPSSLITSLFLKGYLFQTKYIVFYGISSLVNQFVEMKITSLPRCISFMHTNAELWKYFDSGMYDFIKNYLYIPLGGNKASRTKQFFSIMVSFGFISIWHGNSFRIVLWSLLNCIMVLMEHYCSFFFFKSYYHSCMVNYLHEFL